MQAWLENPTFTASESFRPTCAWLSSGDEEALQSLTSHHLKWSSIFVMSGGAVANRCGDAEVPRQLSRSNWNEEREREGGTGWKKAPVHILRGFNSLRVDSRSVHRLLSAALHIKRQKEQERRRQRRGRGSRVREMVFIYYNAISAILTYLFQETAKETYFSSILDPVVWTLTILLYFYSVYLFIYLIN